MKTSAGAGAAQQRPLRVAFIITGLGTGGAESMLERLMGALTSDVVPLVISLGTLGDIGPRLQARGVEVVALGMRRGVPSPLALWRLRQQLLRFRADVVHTWMYHADLVGGLAARLAGIRAVMWGVHQSNLSPTLNRRSTLWVVGVCARLSRHLPMRIACVAQRARDVHIAVGYEADRFVVIPNGFDTGHFKADPGARSSVCQELGLDPSKPIIGMVGRFDAQKNHLGFCEALQKLLVIRPDVQAVVVGAGVDEGNVVLMRWIDEFGVRSACQLLGQRKDIPRLMAALDVLCLPSLGEAFPNVVGEAMACGVPCAVTDVGDTAMMVGSLGRVVASGDMTALAEAMADILTTSALARVELSQKLQEDVRSRFDIHVVAARYEAEYRAMLVGGT